MRSLASSPLSIGAFLCALSGTALPKGEPRFEKLFTRPGVVSEGWVVRDWVDVSEPPKWPVTWDVDADLVLCGTGR